MKSCSSHTGRWEQEATFHSSSFIHTCVSIFTTRCPALSSDATELATDVVEIPESLLATADVLGRKKKRIKKCVGTARIMATADKAR